MSPCARWCSSGPASRFGSPTCRCPSRRPARWRSRSQACAVCRTDLHIVDGELTEPKLPLVPGHQIVGRVIGGSERFEPGQRVGVPWLGWTDGTCRYCRSGRENLCDQRAVHRLRHRRRLRRAHGRRRALLLPAARRLRRRPGRAAPVRRADRLPHAAARGRRRAAGHLRLRRGGAHRRARWRVHQGRRVFAFTRAGDEEAQRFALELGAEWAGDSLGPPPGGARRRARCSRRGRAGAGCAEGRGEGRHGRVRRHPHERHPGDALRAAVGRAGAPLGGEPHPRRRRGVPRRWRRGCRCAPRWRRSRSSRRTRRSTGCARGTCAARPCSCCDPGVPRARRIARADRAAPRSWRGLRAAPAEPRAPARALRPVRRRRGARLPPVRVAAGAARRRPHAPTPRS